MATIRLTQHDNEALVKQEMTVSLAKQAVVSAVAIDEDEDLTTTHTPRSDGIQPTPIVPVKQKISEPPIPSSIDKIREYARITSSRAKNAIGERGHPYKALSSQGKYAHIYIEPFYNWWRNTSVLYGPCVSSISVKDVDAEDGTTTIVNGVSQNYAGFYQLSPQAEELQRLALDRLPIAHDKSVPLLAEAANAAVRDFFGADFCISTATGYETNYVTLPALADKNTVIILDSDCHNSLLTGAYLAQPGAIKKFAHNDANSLAAVLKEVECKFETVLVVFEGLYSMGGDIPPLSEIHELKQVHNFIVLCDEAHSFHSIGSTGHGCVEYWNESHPETMVPDNLIDIRTATMSKAIGGVGGIICGKSQFEQPIRMHIAWLGKENRQTLCTSQMIQLLWVLKQPSRSVQYLNRLADISRFCRAELERFGIHVYGDRGTHILPIHAGRLTISTRLSRGLRARGLLGVPISAPAVPFWQSRIRLNLTASLTDSEVDKLLDAVIDGCKENGICKKPEQTRREYCHTTSLHSSYQQELEASQAFEDIIRLLKKTANEFSQKAHDGSVSPLWQAKKSIIQKGHDARAIYGLGSGGSRWILTFPPHLAVEALIAKRTATESCMTFPDTNIGLASTIAALSRPLLGYQKHTMLMPEETCQAIEDGLIFASKKDRPDVVRYRDAAQLYELVKTLSKSKSTYLTIHLSVADASNGADISSILSKICKSRPLSAGMTILIDSPASVPQTAQLKDYTDLSNVQILVSGSFHKMLNLPGGFIAGSEILINELRMTCRGYMFTTSTQPFAMEMVRASLEENFQASEI